MDQFLNILGSGLEEAFAPATAGLVIAVIGLNLHFGFTGLLNFGQAGFMLLGAYGFAISIIEGLPMLLAVLVGLGLAIVFALILGAPTLKLRGDYLAIVTISAAEILRYVGRLNQLEDFTGGSQGLFGKDYNKPFVDASFLGDGRFTLSPFNYRDIADGALWVRLLGLAVAIALIVLVVRVGRGIKTGNGPALAGRPRLTLVLGILASLVALFFTFPVTYDATGIDGWWARLVGWTLVAIALLVTWLLVRSPWGRVLKGVREDEDAMRSLGKNVFLLKMQALVLGGMLGALGGMVYVISSSVQADSLGRSVTFFAYTALLLGGAAAIFGPVLGTCIFFAGRLLIRELSAAYLPDSIMSDQQSQQFSFIVVGIALMLLVIFRPQGILGDKRELRFNV
ncbi:branched-chain amino acid ABC transporter permease [Nocardioides sp.]|uniref:branched-chain amino acid ABC transporter permease n=1 Tax=Nocardioides sp. TaxID=35761 RepID=UPI003513BC68